MGVSQARAGKAKGFALLTDWADAPRERMPCDEALAATLCDGIEQLDARYEVPPGGGPRRT